METTKFIFYCIAALIIVIILLVRSNVQKSREIKRLYLNNKLRLALNRETYLDFKEYPLDSLKLFENKIDDFLLDLFEKSLKEITILIKGINQIKDKEVHEYLKTSLTTAINRVEIKRLAYLIFINLSDYLFYIGSHKLGKYQIEVEDEHIKYFKFNSFILLCLNEKKYSELIKNINELIEKDESPDLAGNATKRTGLLKAELTKITILTQE
jgi:hypothetical protein